MEILTKGKFVVIYENVYQGDAGEATFEIMGMDSGLVCTKLDRDPMNADTQGAYDVTLASADQSRENHTPATLFLTSYAVSKAIINAIVI